MRQHAGETTPEYIELSDKQCEYIAKANHRYNGKIGATQCGKTFIDIVHVIPARLAERRSKNGLAMILGATLLTIERNVLSPMREFWGAQLVGEISPRNTCVLFGEVVHCLGAASASATARLRGARCKYVYIDEVVEIHPEVFSLLKSRLSLPYSVCDFTGNPAAPGHFIKHFLDSGADVYCQKWTLFDNPFLPPGYVSALQQEYAGSVYYERYVLGNWCTAEGLLYPAFANSMAAGDEVFLVGNLRHYLAQSGQRAHTVALGVDFGGNGSATAFVASVITDGGEVILAMHERITRALDAAALCDAYVAFAKAAQGALGRGYTYADSAEPVLIRTLAAAAARAGLAPVKYARKARIMQRVRLVQALMAQQRFKIARGCTGAQAAFAAALYAPAPNGADMRLDDGSTDVDTLDAFEYSIEGFFKGMLRA